MSNSWFPVRIGGVEGSLGWPAASRCLAEMLDGSRNVNVRAEASELSVCYLVVEKKRGRVGKEKRRNGVCRCFMDGGCGLGG